MASKVSTNTAKNSVCKFHGIFVTYRCVAIIMILLKH